MLVSLLYTFYVSCYSLTVGKCFSAFQLGFFNRSYTLAQFPPTNFTSIIIRVVCPIRCRYQDDMPRLRNMFLKHMRMSCYLIFPVMVAMAALAEPLVETVLTGKQLPTVFYLQILCIAFMWDPVMKISHSVSNAKRHTGYLPYAETWKKFIVFAISLVMIPSGISTMCWGLVLYSLADMGVIICYSRKLIKTGYLHQLCELLPVLLLDGATGTCLYLITPLPLSAWGQLLLGVLSGLIIYIMGSCVFHMSGWQMLLSILSKSEGRSSLSSEWRIFLFSSLSLFFSHIEAWTLLGLLS